MYSFAFASCKFGYIIILKKEITVLISMEIIEDQQQYMCLGQIQYVGFLVFIFRFMKKINKWAWPGNENEKDSLLQFLFFLSSIKGCAEIIHAHKLYSSLETME